MTWVIEMTSFRARLYIFDADGTLRWTTVPGQPCPYRPDEWRLMPNVKETLGRLDWKLGDISFGIASNQNSVALGHLTKSMAVQLLRDTVIEAIGFLPTRLQIECCVCSPTAGCDCRKPQPGLLFRIMDRLSAAPRETLFVGDLEQDREAARRAGVRFVWANDFFGWS
jgi:D-glycero-D-manno-heptose 1,7-bisphosphate phosphatase